MEDQNRTSIEKTEGQLIKLISEDIVDPSLIGIDFQEVSDNLSLHLTHTHGEVTLEQDQKACALSWIRQLSKGHKTFAQTNLNYLENSRKQYSSFRKKLQGQLKQIRKTQDNNEKINDYFITCSCFSCTFSFYKFFILTRKSSIRIFLCKH